jgi:transcriptional regulator with XRE-family HTH domain
LLIKNKLLKGDIVEDIKKLVGDRIRQLRKERRLSQEELGDGSDLHYTHIGSIERGEKNWSIDTLVKVAGGLNVTVNDLLVLPSKPEDIKNLKKAIIAEINESSPEVLRLFSDMVRGVKSLEANVTIKKRTKKK